MTESAPLEIQYDLNPFQLEDAPLLILNSPIDGSAIPTNTYTIEQMAKRHMEVWADKKSDQIT